MSMQITGASTTLIPSNFATTAKQHRQDLKDVMSALKSGDLNAAQQAFTAMTSTSAAGTTGSNPLAQLGKALQAGDLAGAQQAAKDLISTRAAWRQDHQPDGKGAVPNPITDGSTGTLLDVTA
jgi:hypothetical protein